MAKKPTKEIDDESIHAKDPAPEDDSEPQLFELYASPIGARKGQSPTCHVPESEIEGYVRSNRWVIDPPAEAKGE